MTRHCALVFSVAALLSVVPGWAQALSDQNGVSADSVPSPVAFVYVTRPTHIDGFAVASSGKLTPVPGSPFEAGISSMSVNKKFLFGPGDDQENVYTFSIAANGALKLVSQVNAQNYSPACGNFWPVQIDDTGSTLYNQVADTCDTTVYFQSFKIEPNGDLQFLGDVPNPVDGMAAFFYGPIYFLGNNQYAYQAACVDFDGDVGAAPAAFARESSGLLTSPNSSIAIPSPKDPQDNVYCMSALATDPTDHVVMAYRDFNYPDVDYVGDTVLATYSADSHGDLTTHSTYENMLATDLPFVSALSVSPSGKLLAAGGNGFQVFHFNQANPVTRYTGLLQPKIQFLQFGWDKNNHLFALGSRALYVYTVTPTSIKEAPGSPYSIPEASSVIVLDK
jgi:hypothetical protein